MPSKKPTEAPPFDAAAATKDMKPKAWQKFPEWARWVSAIASQDGIGLRDVVNANAVYLDDVKDDLDDHRQTDADRHARINERLAAIEAQLKASPFPA